MYRRKDSKANQFCKTPNGSSGRWEFRGIFRGMWYSWAWREWKLYHVQLGFKNSILYHDELKLSCAFLCSSPPDPVEVLENDVESMTMAKIVEFWQPKSNPLKRIMEALFPNLESELSGFLNQGLDELLRGWLCCINRPYSVSQLRSKFALLLLPSLSCISLNLLSIVCSV